GSSGRPWPLAGAPGPPGSPGPPGPGGPVSRPADPGGPVSRPANPGGCVSRPTGARVAGPAADGVAAGDAPPPRPTGAEVTADGSRGGWCTNAGESAVAALNSSRAAVTSRCTDGWMPPASGTRGGIPLFRTAALT